MQINTSLFYAGDDWAERWLLNGLIHHSFPMLMDHFNDHYILIFPQ